MNLNWLKQGRRMDVLKDVIMLIIITAISYAYMFVMFMIISFVTLSVLHFTIERIFILSAVGTVIVDFFCIWKMVKKYRKA